jgi:hypothetical protein
MSWLLFEGTYARWLLHRGMDATVPWRQALSPDVRDQSAKVREIRRRVSRSACADKDHEVAEPLSIVVDEIFSA